MEEKEGKGKDVEIEKRLIEKEENDEVEDVELNYLGNIENENLEGKDNERIIVRKVKERKMKMKEGEVMVENVLDIFEEN